MKLMVIFVANLALCLATPEWLRTSKDDYSKYKTHFGGRIVGGEVAKIADLPYQVAVLLDDYILCGGSIIAAKTVLTAAHCVEPRLIKLSELSIRAGSARNDTGGRVIQMNGRIVHKDYDQDCNLCPARNDIALLFLAESAIGAGGVASVIALANSVFATGTLGVTSGWGAIAQGSYASYNLLRVNLPVYDQATCQKVYAIDNSYVCAGYEEGGKGPCQGDSGGPFTINGQLVGIASFAIGCARAGYPTLFTSVHWHREWIRANAGI